MSFEKYGWLGTPVRSTFRPRTSLPALVNRIFYSATEKGSGIQVICCDAPGGFKYVVGSKVKAVSAGALNIGEPISLEAGLKDIGSAYLTPDFGKSFSLSARLVVSDLEFAKGFYKSVANEVLSAPGMLLVELAKIALGIADEQLDVGSPLFQRASDQGELSAEEIKELRAGWGAWFKGQKHSGLEQLKSHWRHAGWELNTSSSDKFVFKMEKGGVFYMKSSDESRRQPSLFEPLLINAFDHNRTSFGVARLANDVNQASLVIKHWISEIKEQQINSRYNELLSKQVTTSDSKARGPKLG